MKFKCEYCGQDNVPLMYQPLRHTYICSECRDIQDEAEDYRSGEDANNQ